MSDFQLVDKCFHCPHNCKTIPALGRGGVLPYMGYIGMCRCEWYGFSLRQGIQVRQFGSKVGKQEFALKNKKNCLTLNLFTSASSMLIDGCYKTLMGIINCQKSRFRRKSAVLILVKDKQFIVLDNAYVIRIRLNTGLKIENPCRKLGLTQNCSL